jgi:hypothetical protein
LKNTLSELVYEIAKPKIKERCSNAKPTRQI